MLWLLGGKGWICSVGICWYVLLGVGHASSAAKIVLSLMLAARLLLKMAEGQLAEWAEST